VRDTVAVRRFDTVRLLSIVVVPKLVERVLEIDVDIGMDIVREGVVVGGGVSVALVVKVNSDVRVGVTRSINVSVCEKVDVAESVQVDSAVMVCENVAVAEFAVEME
jgi:hypothetical protein